MMRKNSDFIGCGAGFIGMAVVAGLSFWKMKPGAIVTGILWGAGIAYTGVLVYALLLPCPHREKEPFWWRYLSGLVLRYAIMIGLFCLTVFILRIHPIGLLIGMFAGMTVSTLFFLNKIRHPGLTPPEAR